ncbi:mucin-3B-like [Saccostrea echinata]|uniref:mucin-3B-like n=1 Tax=Saccostrea echinata TaxID=191078 RepID=UPI002A82F0A5|nr:mucin-3B-like [Saccostrea echinata]
MTSFRCFLAAVVGVAILAVGEGLQCLQCTGVSFPQDCTTVVNCSDHYQCFTDFYVTEQGFLYYDLGCRIEDTCRVLNGRKRTVTQPVKRQFENLHLCEECCTKEFCNRQGCPDKTVNMVNGTVCFNCPDAASPGTCEKVDVCNYDETCLATLVLTELFQERYQRRCEKKHVCQDSVGGQFHGHPKSLPIAFGKRQFQFPITECQYCCDDNFCNNKECVKGMPTTKQPSTTTTHKITTHRTTHPSTHPTTHITVHKTQPTTTTTAKPTHRTHPTTTTTHKTHPTTTTTHKTHPTTTTTKATTTTTHKTTTTRLTTTTTIPVCGPKAADIVFVLDASESLSHDDFEIEKDFVYNFTKKFKIGRDNVQFGCITFGDTVRNDFYLNTYHDRNQLLQKIQSLTFLMSGTNTADALKFVRENAFSHSHGGRHSASRIVVVLTDGKSKDTNKTIAEAKQLQHQATVHAIGIGSLVNTQELSAIDSNGKPGTVSGFDVLHTMGDYLMDIACPGSHTGTHGHSGTHGHDGTHGQPVSVLVG